MGRLTAIEAEGAGVPSIRRELRRPARVDVSGGWSAGTAAGDREAEARVAKAVARCPVRLAGQPLHRRLIAGIGEPLVAVRSYRGDRLECKGVGTAPADEGGKCEEE